MNCNRCGKPLAMGAAVCPHCGARLAVVGQPEAGAGFQRVVHRPPVRTSGLAIASLVLALLGIFTFGLTALPGLILGCVGLWQMGRSDGYLQGKGLAIAGAAISGVVLLFVPIMAAILFPVFAQAREQARSQVCLSNMKQLSTAMQMYAQDYDGRLPRRTNWCNATLPYGKGKQIYVCPSVPGGRPAYAFNARLSSASLTTQPAKTTVLFDSRPGWNLSGGMELALPRHRDGIYVGDADGHVRWVAVISSRRGPRR